MHMVSFMQHPCLLLHWSDHSYIQIQMLAELQLTLDTLILDIWLFCLFSTVDHGFSQKIERSLKD